MARPLIGITTNPSDAPDRASLDNLLQAIVQGVEDAGGLPVLVPLSIGPATLRAVYERLDGVLLPGGGDVAPDRYGAEATASVGGVDVDRDRVELELARWVVADGKPVFGICRGSQVLNVALGGSLYVDTDDHADADRHAYYPGLPFDLRPHDVSLAPGSLLAQIVSRPTLAVNSLHHQAVREVAPGLRVVARAPDGMVEAVEIEGHPFGLAVQWHPEALPDAPEMRALFEAFVRACGVHHSPAYPTESGCASSTR